MKSWRDVVGTAWRASAEHYAGLEIRAAPGLHRAAYELLLPHLRPNLRVLDLAAGTGAFLARLRTAGIQSIEAVELDVAGFGLKDIPVHQIDLNSDFAARLPNARSLVCAIEIIEHLDSPRHFLEQIHRLLDDHGLLLVSTPNIQHWVGRLQFLWRAQLRYFSYADYRHQRHISPMTDMHLRIMLEETGFQVLAHRTAGCFWGPAKRVPLAPASLAAVLLWGRQSTGDASIYLARKVRAAGARAEGRRSDSGGPAPARHVDSPLPAYAAHQPTQVTAGDSPARGRRSPYY